MYGIELTLKLKTSATSHGDEKEKKMKEKTLAEQALIGAIGDHQLDEGAMGNVAKAMGMFLRMPFAVFTNMIRHFFGKNKEMDAHKNVGGDVISDMVKNGNLSGLMSELQKGKEVLFGIWYPDAKAEVDPDTGIHSFKNWKRLPIDVTIPNRILLAYNNEAKVFDISKLKPLSYGQISLSLAHTNSSDKITKIITPLQYKAIGNSRIQEFEQGIKFIKDAIKANMLAFSKANYNHYSKQTRDNLNMSGFSASSHNALRGNNNLANSLGAHSIHTWFWGLDKEFLDSGKLDEVYSSIDGFAEFVVDSHKRYMKRLAVLESIKGTSIKKEETENAPEQNQETAQAKADTVGATTGNTVPKPNPSQVPNPQVPNNPTPVPQEAEPALMQGLVTFGDILSENSENQDTVNVDSTKGDLQNSQQVGDVNYKNASEDTQNIVEQTFMLMQWIQLNFTWVPAYTQAGFNSPINNKSCVFMPNELSKKIDTRFLFAKLTGSAILATQKQHAFSIGKTSEDIKGFDELVHGSAGNEVSKISLNENKTYEFVFDREKEKREHISFKVLKVIEVPKNELNKGFVKGYDIENSTGVVYQLFIKDWKQSQLKRNGGQYMNGIIIDPSTDKTTDVGDVYKDDSQDSKSEDHVNKLSELVKGGKFIFTSADGKEFPFTVINTSDKSALVDATAPDGTKTGAVITVGLFDDGSSTFSSVGAGNKADGKYELKGSITANPKASGEVTPEKAKEAPPEASGEASKEPDPSTGVDPDASAKVQKEIEQAEKVVKLVKDESYVFENSETGEEESFTVKDDGKESGDVVEYSVETGDNLGGTTTKALISKKIDDKNVVWSIKGADGKEVQGIVKKTGDSVKTASEGTLAGLDFSVTEEIAKDMKTVLKHIKFGIINYAHWVKDIKSLDGLRYITYKDGQGAVQKIDIGHGNIGTKLEKLADDTLKESDEIKQKAMFIGFVQLLVAVIYVHASISGNTDASLQKAIADVLGADVETKEGVEGVTGAESWPTNSMIALFLDSVFGSGTIPNDVIDVIDSAVANNQKNFQNILKFQRGNTKVDMSDVKLVTETKIVEAVDWLDSASELI